MIKMLTCANSITNFFLKSIVILTVIQILFGCSTYLIKKYSYIPVSDHYWWGELTIRLKGTWSADNNIDILGSPYELALWLKINPKNYNKIKMKTIKIVDAKSDNIVYENNLQILKKINKTGNFLLYKGIEVPYMDYDIIIHFTLMGSQDYSNTEFQTHLKLKRKYEQARKNRFWSMLMSV